MNDVLQNFFEDRPSIDSFAHRTMEGTSIQERFAVKNPDLIQLYSIATPNGIKAAACLEELVLLKQGDFEFNYEPHSVDIRHAENKTEYFTKMNPNQKIPVIVDPRAGNSQQSVSVFESGAILLYLAEKYDELLPHDCVERAEVLKWLFWGSTGLSGAVKQFGFYYKYCQHSLPYCVARYKKEVTRLLTVLDTQLSHGRHFVTGDMYTIADICIWPWINGLHENYDDAVQREFGNLANWPHLQAWYQRCMARPASRKSLEVCSFGTVATA